MTGTLIYSHLIILSPRIADWLTWIAFTPTLRVGNSANTLEKLLQGENFSKLYAWALEKSTAKSTEDHTNIAGRWIKYDRGSNYSELVRSLQGQNTGWCTAAESTAEVQLKDGDFYVYYSFDKDGQPTIPRAAIRMQGPQIAEVRGVAAEQNLESGLETVVESKLDELPDGDRYKQRVHDMALLTEIEKKVKNDIELTRDDLTFLYEIDHQIEGFGWNKDPRIEEIRAGRHYRQDLAGILNCEFNQIARSYREIHSGTKVYMGKLTPGIFGTIGRFGVEHVFDENMRKIEIHTVDSNGKSVTQLLSELEQAGVEIRGYAKSQLESINSQSKSEQAWVVTFTVGDLSGEDYGERVDDIEGYASGWGLEECPADI